MNFAFVGNHPTEIFNEIINILPNISNNHFRIKFTSNSKNNILETIKKFEVKYQDKFIPLELTSYNIQKSITIYVYKHMFNNIEQFIDDNIDVIICNDLSMYNLLKNIFHHIYFYSDSKYQLIKLLNESEKKNEKYNLQYLLIQEINKLNNYPVGIINYSIKQHNNKIKKKFSIIGSLGGSLGISSLTTGLLLLPIPIIGQISGVLALGIAGGIGMGSGLIGSFLGDYSGKLLSKSIQKIELDETSFQEIIKYIKGNYNDIVNVDNYLSELEYTDITFVLYRNKLYRVEGKFDKKIILEIYHITELKRIRKKIND